jgi:glutathione S-transferase
VGSFPQDEPIIDFYYAATPNGWKISIMLEELGLPNPVLPPKEAGLLRFARNDGDRDEGEQRKSRRDATRGKTPP